MGAKQYENYGLTLVREPLFLLTMKEQHLQKNSHS